MPRPARIAPQIPAAVTDRLSAFQKVFFSKPPFVSGVYSIDKADYLLYYGGPQNPRCIDLANAADADLQHLSDACAPATFGLNNTDVYDEDYRKARKMDVDAFSCKFDPAHSGLLELIWPEFLSDGGDIKQKVVCELYKLNVYGQGSFFKAHKDTPRSDTMFGSLVVVFPTPHEGGALILRENEKEWTFDSAAEVLADGSPKLGYVVFFSDVEHEVTKVTSGYRVTLTYNLYFNAKSTDEPTTLLHQPHLPSGVSKVGQELKIMLQDFLACPDFLPDGGFLGFGLRFLYPLDATKPVSTISSSLKGCDAMLQAVCDELGLQHSLHAVYKTSAGCDYYSGDSDGDKTVHIVRDTFWKGTHQQVDMDLYHYIRDKKSILLRAAGTRTFKDDYGKVVPTKEVHWVTKVPTQYNVVKSHYVAYGNEAEMAFTYGMPVLIAPIGTFAERNGQEAAVKTEDTQVSGGTSSQPAPDPAQPARGKAANTRAALRPAVGGTAGATGGRKLSPAVATAAQGSTTAKALPATSNETGVDVLEATATSAQPKKERKRKTAAQAQPTRTSSRLQSQSSDKK